MYTLDVFHFHSKDEPSHYENETYKDHITSCQIEIGLIDVIQTCIGQLNNTHIALRVRDLLFTGGSR